MDKKIPKVFANKVDSDGNNEKVYHSTDKVLDDEKVISKFSYKKNINQKINDIFNFEYFLFLI